MSNLEDSKMIFHTAIALAILRSNMIETRECRAFNNMVLKLFQVFEAIKKNTIKIDNPDEITKNLRYLINEIDESISAKTDRLLHFLGLLSNIVDDFNKHIQDINNICERWNRIKSPLQKFDFDSLKYMPSKDKEKKMQSCAKTILEGFEFSNEVLELEKILIDRSTCIIISVIKSSSIADIDGLEKTLTIIPETKREKQ